MGKYYLAVTLLIGSFFFASAQSLSPTVIASSGGFYTGAAGSVSYTVGEMTMVETFTGGSSVLTQGFQQPNDNLVSILNITHDAFGSFAVYPNPAVENLWFGFSFPESGKVTVSLLNELGQKVNDVYTGTYTEGKTTQQLAVSSFSAGVYILSVTMVSDKDGKTHITNKKFQVIN